jgi:NADH:ubiquinone oxidoreductase subunit 5 (subunit L)/multisubunit Na+/H+ antiporter MnhA subunit
VAFLIGGAAACALPPLNGFASKYLIYQDLFRLSFCCNSQINCFVGLFFIALLSLVGALSLALFAKAIGISFLGRPRSEAASQAIEASLGMKAAQAILALSCFGIGVVSAPLARFLQLKFGTYLGILPTRMSFEITSVMLSLPFIAVSGISLFLLVFHFCLYHKKGNKDELGLKRYITWDCGYGALGSRAEETASSFSAPITRLFAPLYYYKVTTEIHGKDRRHFPESIKAEVLIISFLETHIYRPVIRFLQMLSHLLVRLQTGSIHVHLLYIFVTLLFLLLIGVRL